SGTTTSGAANDASQSHGLSVVRPTHVRISHTNPPTKVPRTGASAAPRDDRSACRKWSRPPTAPPKTSAMMICMSGDEADATRMVASDLSEGDRRGGDDVRAALGVGERQEVRAGLQRVGDVLLHGVRRLVGLEGELSRGVREA